MTPSRPGLEDSRTGLTADLEHEFGTRPEGQRQYMGAPMGAQQLNRRPPAKLTQQGRPGMPQMGDPAFDDWAIKQTLPGAYEQSLTGRARAAGQMLPADPAQRMKYLQDNAARLLAQLQAGRR